MLTSSRVSTKTITGVKMKTLNAPVMLILNVMFVGFNTAGYRVFCWWWLRRLNTGLSVFLILVWCGVQSNHGQSC